MAFERDCKHCGEEFKQGQLFLDICNKCLNSGHEGGSKCCPINSCLRNSLRPDVTDSTKWNLNIEGMTFDQIRKAVIRLTLTNFNGNARAAARSLNIGHATVYRNLSQWERSGRMVEGRGLVRGLMSHYRGAAWKK